jgi:hypothetical protein
MAGPRTAVDYISDDGNTYRLRMDASNAAHAGNGAATATVGLPSGYEPRYVWASTAGGSRRKVIICDPANALFVGGDNAMDLIDFSTQPSAIVSHQVLSRVGERRYNR